MPSGDHRSPGVHAVEMLRRAAAVTIESVDEEAGALSIQVQVENVGAGHFFPTTATPRAVLQVRLLGASGPIAGTVRRWPVGRSVVFQEGAWTEIDDTRIPPRSSRRWRYTVPKGAAEEIEASLFVYPDWIYIGFYEGQLARTDLAPQARNELQDALGVARTSGMTVAAVRHAL